ncbi:hypothetical protein NLX83_06470 [Allokutzneria sp. A3M-2-11 16]|uniref:WXG100 family type VII secretion target n=1 Tax=Allokutzneria sp. A3M-2-11 16 TaxID=2962043 RepID=UPI0020B7D81E|nr:hypothetical protein [Allokutzneria sp. A3M-2-11 16]MCP3798898.1 hypothetical protein [Allokutzneria sp. A3M-2-11 16]
MINLVTGNPDALSDAAKNFAEAGKGLSELSKEILQTATTGLRDWEGTAADKAKERIGRFAAGVDSAAGNAGGIAEMLHTCSMVVKVAEDFVKGLLTDLVEWLIITWVAAAATAPVTLGASTAAAGAASTARIASTTAEAGRKINVLTRLFAKIRDLLAKLRQHIAKNRNSSMIEKFMAPTGAGGKLREDAGLGGNARIEGGAFVREQAADKISEIAKNRLADTVGLGYDGQTKKFGFDEVTKWDGTEKKDMGKVGRKALDYAADVSKVVEYGETGTSSPSDQTAKDLDL